MSKGNSAMRWQLTVPLVLCAALWCSQTAMGLWPPAEGVPTTPWTKDVSFDRQPLPEYPRPQFVRDAWLNLNGKWDYAVTRHGAERPDKFDRAILVPFPPQSMLSQINQAVGPDEQVWYRREFELPAAWAGKRVLLHFGAVDWESHVRVNNRRVGSHTGGYDDFTLDITSALQKSGKQEVVVSAWNPIEGGQPHGKQALKPDGIFYTPTSGIWQTVWLEPVEQSSIDRVTLTPDVDHQQIRIAPVIASSPDLSLQITAVVSDGGKEVARGTGGSLNTIAISIPDPKLWWPASPFLYDLKLTLSDSKTGKTLDSVGSYFGMRKISVGPGPHGAMRMLLNNHPVFENGFLDQGFWPDGIYTAPADAALKYDLEMLRKFGFNMDRKHIKVEPDRWYYWADKLGVLVWQDMPACVEMSFPENERSIADREGNYESELRRMIRGRINHPCVVMWILFNEGWGLELADRPTNRDPVIASPNARLREERMVTAARQEDPTRLIDAESGTGGGGNDHGEDVYDFGLGDVVDYHCYGHEGPKAEAKRAAVVGEYGWGLAPVVALRARMMSSKGADISGCVVTQLTDVEGEHNGALTYGRAVIPSILAEKDLAGSLRQVLHEFGEDDFPGGPSDK